MGGEHEAVGLPFHFKNYQLNAAHHSASILAHKLGSVAAFFLAAAGKEQPAVPSAFFNIITGGY